MRENVRNVNHQLLVVHMIGEVLDVSRKPLETKNTKDNDKICHLLKKKAELANKCKMRRRLWR